MRRMAIEIGEDHRTLRQRWSRKPKVPASVGAVARQDQVGAYCRCLNKDIVRTGRLGMKTVCFA